MLEKIEDIFNALQELEAKPTPHNVSILSGVYQVLREIYQEMEGTENAGTGSGMDEHEG